MEQEQVWCHVAAHRRALGSILGTLDDDEWTMPSACPGWTARDVAAHVISHP